MRRLEAISWRLGGWRLPRVLCYVLILCSASGASKARGGNAAHRDAIKRIRTKSLKILLVDDEGEYRGSMRALLERVFDARVDDVDSGAAGIAKVRAGNQYD